MKFRFVKKQLNEIIAESVKLAKNDGKEMCGLLIRNKLFVDLIQTRNKEKKGGSFSFYVNEVRQIQKAVKILGYEAIGTLHSHPCDIARPGESDIYYALDDSYLLIIGVDDREAKLWHVKNKKIRNVKYELI